MNPFKTISSILFLSLFLFFACEDKPQQQSSAAADVADTDNTSDATARAVEAPTSDIQLGVCLWPEAGLRSIAGRSKDAKWIAGMSFGEVVTLTGNSEEAGERNYLEMELSDGKVGWSYEYLFAVNALRAAATGSVDVYGRPDLSTFDGKQFERGEIFAVVEGTKNEDGWLEVFGKEKKMKGWIKENTNYSTEETDVNVAIMFSRAMLEKNPIAQAEKLEIISKGSAFANSPLMSIVNEKLSEIKQLTELPANQLMVTTDNLNARSEPNTETENVLFKLQSGDVCNIIERGARAEIRKMNDYWYLVEKDGNEGWIYGYFTSKKQEEVN